MIMLFSGDFGVVLFFGGFLVVIFIRLVVFLGMDWNRCELVIWYFFKMMFFKYGLIFIYLESIRKNNFLMLGIKDLLYVFITWEFLN